MRKCRFAFYWLGLANLVSVFALTLSAQTLRFDANGNFKIAQFTDVHFNYGETASEAATQLIEEVLEKEKPDLVILTGDIVTAKPVKEGWLKVTQPIVDRKLPFVVTFGNHDDEHGWSRDSISNLLQTIPGNLSADRAKSGNPDAVIELLGANNNVGGLLYCLDSKSYSTLKHIEGYGWFTQPQINWFRETSANYTAANNNQPLPALAFFHIPLPEYTPAFGNEKVKPVGVKNEKECAPQINTGMFAAMQEAGDVMGTFVGHDHVNDYIAYWHGIALAYGRFSGGKTTYGDLVNGARIINMKENQRTFDTYIHVLGKGKIHEASFDPKGQL